MVWLHNSTQSPTLQEIRLDFLQSENVRKESKEEHSLSAGYWTPDGRTEDDYGFARFSQPHELRSQSRAARLIPVALRQRAGKLPNSSQKERGG